MECFLHTPVIQSEEQQVAEFTQELRRFSKIQTLFEVLMVKESMGLGLHFPGRITDKVCLLGPSVCLTSSFNIAYLETRKAYLRCCCAAANTSSD